MVELTGNGARKWRIAQRLREARSNQVPKVSQSALARRVNKTGLSYFQSTHASRLECGYMDATWSEVEAIAQALGVKADWLANTAEAAPTPAITLTRPSAPVQASARSAVPPPPPPSSPPAPQAALPAQPAPPPAEDGLLPDLSLLAQGSRSSYDYRLSLVEALAKATEMLHRPRLPARSWRAWREFDHQVRDLLRQLPAN